MKKKWPVLKSDEEAERFVETADLSEDDFSQMVPMPFELEKKTEQVNLRMPASMVEALKERARKRGVPYQRLIREAIAKSLR